MLGAQLIVVALIDKYALNVILIINFFKILNVLSLMNAIMVIFQINLFLLILVAVFKAISGTINECADACPGNC